tara:strand:+ start:62821 stop:64215 length:1395 start_codon:yes stop_codon:yes gene_type:complete
MAIKFYNTISKKKELFKPINELNVGLYTCGPTVYDNAHIGNFRTFLFEDLLKRYLIHRGYDVYHVMNITDIDDKTIKKAKGENILIKQITKKYTERFIQDSEILKIIPANQYPKATNFIPEMINMIKELIRKGYAYLQDDGSVYFNINSYKRYGQLASLSLINQQKTNRVLNDEYNKDNPQDFALWKSWKKEDGDIFWDSPWGKGRPGWHIECSVMSNEILGDHFDIHCGGVDNIFPHHENEIAQSRCYTGKKFVNYWLHSEHLLIDGGKMSKSAGALKNIDELIKLNYSPESIRYLLLSGHYRTKISWSESKKKEGDRIVKRLSNLKNRLLEKGADLLEDNNYPKEYYDFIDKLDDDLDTPAALAIFFKWIRMQNEKLENKIQDPNALSQAWSFLLAFDSIFGIIKSESEIIPNEIKKLLEKRKVSRKNKDWDMADQIRKEIENRGWIIEDIGTGYRVKKQGS